MDCTKTVFCHSLDSLPSGAEQLGGTFSEEGFQTTDIKSSIAIDLGTYIAAGYVEIEIKGFKLGLEADTIGKNPILSIWNVDTGDGNCKNCAASFIQMRFHTPGAPHPEGSLLFRLTSRNTEGSSGSHEGVIEAIDWDPENWYTYRATWTENLGTGSNLMLDGDTIDAGSQPNLVVNGGMRYLYIGDDIYQGPGRYSTLVGLSYRNVKVVNSLDTTSVVVSPQQKNTPITFSLIGKEIKLIGKTPDREKIRIVDLQGKLIKHLELNGAQLSWDGRDRNNKLVPSSLYILLPFKQKISTIY
ncbi:MAG: hypothetical protein HQK83_15100 [Fibrobacteria bacterium]|nr:hypothetical protein [Fibrobacteria bacterium]